MIGGTVLEIIVLPDRVWINCVEDNSESKCAIYVESNEKSKAITPGDGVWWQGGWAMWTPYKIRGSKDPKFKSGKDFDIKMPRIGCSGVSRPIPKHV